jgi:hypothetical protein
MGMTKAAVKNAKRDERRARKRSEKASAESIQFEEEPFTPPRTTPVGSPVAPGAPMRPSLRRALGVCTEELEELRTALRDSLGEYNSLRDACAACTTCSATVRAMEAKPSAGDALVSAFEPFYF